MIKVFVSYTLLDTQLSISLLKKLKCKLEEVHNIQVYIDILDNKNSLDPQGEVYSQLYSADVFWKINSDQYSFSVWALKELNIAEKCNKPIFNWNINNINTIINNSSALNVENYVSAFLP